MYSSAIPGLSVFCDWLFVVFFGVSLKTTANFLLCHDSEWKALSVVKSELIFNFVTTNVDLLYYEGKKFQQKQTVNDVEFGTIPKGYNL